MIPLRWEDKPVGLRNPALVCAFTGWTDAGDAASSAIGVINRRLGAQRCASVDPELLFSTQNYRPRLTVEDGVAQKLTWPTVELYAAVVPTAKRDLLLVTGPEPSMRWQSLTATLIDAAKSLDASLVISLGALLSDVPHTRPVPLTGIASDVAMIAELDPMLPDYDGPSGITAMVHMEAQEQGIPTASLLAHVPHYVAGVPSPKATLALVRAVEFLTGVDVPTERLERASARYEEQVTEAVERDPERRELLERLEHLADIRESEEPEDDGSDIDINPLEMRNLPSGDSLADEFQQFLRQQDEEE